MKKHTTPGAMPIAEPLRQGFYRVTLSDSSEIIAEWRERGKNTGKRWWVYVSDDPTIAKTPVPLDSARVVTAFTPAGKLEVEALMMREKTVAEKIDNAYQSFLAQDETELRYKCEIPPGRHLQFGDALEYGSLDECQVVALRDEGRVVIFSYHETKQKHGELIDMGTHYRAVYWTEVLPRFDASTKLARSSRIYGAYMNSTLSAIIRRGLRGLDDSPKYQRDYVWKQSDKELFLESVFAGRELGRFIFITREYPHVDQVLDGKQRIHCLMEFVTSQIPYSGLYWHEMSRQDRLLFEGRSVQFAELKEAHFSPADFMEIFLEVNVAGVPQSEEHLDSVRAMLQAERAKENV